MKILFLLLLFIPFLSFGQLDIPNAQAGKCYAKCLGRRISDTDSIDSAGDDIEVLEWHEVLCNDKLTGGYIIRQIQLALMANGYDLGLKKADNIMSRSTKTALTKYQKENGLPIGNLNFETLKSLGVKYE
jgi:Putative peptidoglycan binding domain